MAVVLYREALESDIPAMARLRAITWGTEDYWTTRITAYMNRELHPQKALKPRVLYVAVENNSLVGMIAGHLTRRFDCAGELEWIDVVPERRGTGIASELLRHLAKWFVEQKALRVCVDVDPDNASAQKFYRRHGAEDLRPHWLVWPDIRTSLASDGRTSRTRRFNSKGRKR